jgi:hypothetical protein
MKIGLVRIIFSTACGVLGACAASGEPDRADDMSDGDDIAAVSQALTLPPADRATTFINADDPSYLTTPPPQGPAPAGMCLDENTSNGQLQLWPCHGQDNQRWALDGIKGPSDLTSRRALTSSTGRCVAPASSNDGAPVRAYLCETVFDQGWEHTRAGQLKHRGTGKCLDANAGSGSIGQGTLLQLWTCHGGGNQKWKFGSTILRSAASGRCLDVNAPNGQIGSAVQIWDCHGQSNQRWQRRFADFRGSVFVGDANGNCLTATGLANHAAVSFQPCGAVGGQEFSYLTDGSIFHLNSRRCLDVAGDVRDNSTPLQLYDCHGGANQRWTTR